MGFWNTTLYSNDTTCDVKNSYLELLAQDNNNQNIDMDMVNEYQELMNTDEEPLFWYALADTQWNIGCLSELVRNQALKFIEQKAGAEFWKDDINKQNEWFLTLSSLKNKIQSPPTRRRKIRKNNQFVRNPWNLGDIYAYEFHTEKAKNNNLFGKYILLQKIGEVEYYQGVFYSVIRFFNVIFQTLPHEVHIEQYSILPLTLSPKESNIMLSDYCPKIDWYLCATMMYEKKDCYPSKHLSFVTNYTVDDKNYVANQMTDFYLTKNDMEDWLIDFYLSWIDMTY